MQRKTLRKRKSKIILVLLIVLFIITGCKKDDNSADALAFKEEFESYNDLLTKLDISIDNPFVYTNDVYSLVENEKAFVLFIGNPKDEGSRKMVDSILKASSKYGLKNVYYLQMFENDSYEIGGVKIDKIPSLVAIVRKEVNSVVNNKDKVDTIIETVVQELSSCDLEQGC